MARARRWRCHARRALAAVIAILVLALLPALALNFPALTGRVVDEAGILGQANQSALTQKLADLEAKTGNQLVVATLRSLQGTSIEDFGYQLGRTWRIGQAGRNNGALLIVAPNERKVRIEVGYGLEGTLTDAVTRLIIENAILPRFRANDFPGGIARGVDDIIQVLSGDAEDFKQRAAQRPDTGTGLNSTLIWLAVFGFIGFVFIMIVIAIRQDLNKPFKRGRSSAAPWMDSSSSSSSSSSSGSSSWGSSSSSGSSSGGFSGGGGSFGGGGSSGSW
jgi:uncharacterized protein